MFNKLLESARCHGTRSPRSRACRTGRVLSIVRYTTTSSRSVGSPSCVLSARGRTSPTSARGYEFLGSMINMDRPRHTRFRLIVNRGFTPHQVASLEERSSSCARTIVDAIADKGECELRHRGSRRRSRSRYLRQMGIPASELPVGLHQTNVVPGERSGVRRRHHGGVLAAQELWSYAQELRADRMATLATTSRRRISQAEVAGTAHDRGVRLVLRAARGCGNETTRNSISPRQKALTDNHQTRARLARRPRRGVAQRGRGDHPLVDACRALRRTAPPADAEVGGQQIKEGRQVVRWYSAANRDRRVFENRIASKCVR